jgi:hypothetical protein
MKMAKATPKLDRLLLFAGMAFIAGSCVAEAQEIAYLDLTDVTPRVELRHPPAPPAKCGPKGCVGAGFAGMSVSCGGVAANETRALKTSLTWLDQLSYRNGDRAEFEAAIENVGTVALDIPWSPHLADLQPRDESANFEVESLSVGLFLRWGEHYSVSLGSLHVYGTPSHPETILTLGPGESVRLRGTVKISLPPRDTMKVPFPGSDQRAGAGTQLQRIEYSPHPLGINQSIENLYPRTVEGNELSVKILWSTGKRN